MKLKNIDEVEGFIATVDSCVGYVWLESIYGDRYNLKSKLSQYIALGALLGVDGDNLELFCQLPEDERKFYKYFDKNSGVI